MAVHFAPSTLAGPWGDWGVRGFFVLSGFLITHGLLAARARIDANQSTIPKEIRSFFFRRAVRLWPLYFAAIAVMAALNVETSRALLPWNLTFTLNYFITITHQWPGIHSHFWTLAVEQQFYLLWPFLFLIAPLRAGITAVGLLIVLSPVLRACEITFLASRDVASSTPSGVLLPMCADALSWGALLALTLHLRPTILQRYARLGGHVALVLFIGLFFFNKLGPSHFSAPWLHALSGTIIAVASSFLVAHCVGDSDSRLRRILRFGPATYLGVISYGIYVIHNFVHWIGPSILLRVYGATYFATELARVSYLVALSIALAVLSWHSFERPLLRLSRRWLSLP
jgi:peptidoglycan/LPS O-acetylase OafA/YrhL